MSTIDEKVVSAKFNNAQFEANAKTTLGTLSALAKGLKLDNASKGLESVSAAAKNANLGSLASAVDGLSSKFSALSVVGVTALATISSKAVNAGINLAKSLTIGPIGNGFSDYNEKLTSVQTIMNSTGKSLTVVNKYFKELDTYADQTIYNLSDMTGALAKFVNAGVSLEKAVPAIKGIANMTALAGQGAGAASIAMYNLSQSIAGGFLTTTDYKSLNLANVATKQWKDYMVQTAVAAGTLKKVGKDAYHIVGQKAGTASTTAALFNEKLSEGWATSKVLLKTLGDYGNPLTTIGRKALAAAQDVKSLPMMLDTLKAGVGTGWTDTFEIVLGDINESKKLFTGLTNYVGKFLGDMQNARNKTLAEWKKFGGRTALLDGLKNGFQALFAIIKPIKDAFTEMFPAKTGKQLAEMTKNFRDFTAGLKIGSESADRIKRTFAGVFAIFKVGYSLISAVVKTFFSLFGIAQGGAGGFLAITAAVGDFLVKIQEWLVTSGRIKSFFATIDTARAAVLVPLIAILSKVVEAFGLLFSGDTAGFVDKLKEAFGGLGALMDGLWKSATSGIRGYLANARDAAGIASEFLKGLGIKALEPFQKGLAILSTNLGKFRDVLSSFSLDVFNKGQKGASEGISVLTNVAQKAKDVWSSLADMFSGVGSKVGPILSSLGNLFTTITDKLAEFVDKMDMQDAVALINTGMFILMYKSIKDFMNILADGVKSFQGIGEQIQGAIGQLTDTLKTMQKDVQANIILKIAVAVGILVASLAVLANIDAAKLISGIVAIGVLMKMLNMSMGYLAELNVADDAKILSAAAGMILLAVAIRILAGAVEKISDLSWGEMIKGLVGVGALLAGMTLFAKYAKADSSSLSSGAGLLLMAVAIRILASAVSSIAKLSVAEITKGLAAITLMMAGLGAMTLIMSDTKGVFRAAAGMLVLSVAMMAMSLVLRIYAAMDWSTILKGLGAVVLSIAGIGIAMQTMPKSGSGQLLVAAGALVVLAGALRLIGTMKLGDIAKGVIAITVMLAAVVVAVNLLTGAMLGAQALLLISASLLVFAGAMKILGSLSWEAIGKGLVAIAGLFVILGLAGLVLAPVVPVIIALGAALTLMGQGLLWAGAGALAFAGAFAILAGVGTAGFAVITVGIMGLLNLIPLFAQQVGLGIRAIAVVIAQSGPQIFAAMTTVALAILKAIDTVAPRAMATFVKLILLFLRAIDIVAPKVFDSGMKLILGFLRAIANNIGKIVTAGGDIIVNFLRGIQKQVPRIADEAAKTIIAFVQGTADAINNNADKLDTAGRNLASAIIQGMVRGITAGIRWVASAAKDMAGQALAAAKNALGIKSPSREFAKLGAFSAAGYAKGLDGGRPQIIASANSLRSLINAAMKNAAGDIKTLSARLDRLKHARNKDNRAIRETTKALAQARVEYSKAKKASSVAYSFGDENKKLLSLADKQASIAKQLESANKTLADAIKTRDDYNKQVKDQFSNLPDAANDVKLADYITELQKKVADTQIFNAQLQKLRDLGLNDEMYKELLAKGTDAIPFVTQILDGGKSAVDEINTLDSALAKAATSIGDTASKALYQAAVDSAQGIVKGLQSQQAAIEKQMDVIAAAMVKSIKKALGIKSPSREFMKVGDWSIKGLAAGLKSASSVSEDAAASVGHDTINSLRKTLTGLSDLVGDDLNVDPTIRPVLDLSQVQKDAVKMGDILKGDPLSVGSAYSKARNLAAGYDNNRALLDYLASGQPVGKVFTLNQTINSPKAVNPATVYRNTKNVISTVKGELRN